jgi:hypothetical protein
MAGTGANQDRGGLEKFYEKERQEKSFPPTWQSEFFSDGQPRDTGSILRLGTPALIVD